MNDYRPINCDQHSGLEVLALRRTAVVIDSRGGRGERESYTGQIVDLLTRDGAEYLVVEMAGERQQLRLDRLLEIRDPDGQSLWSQKNDD
jgi:transcriptional antiterminator Rof (Rho-off)